MSEQNKPLLSEEIVNDVVATSQTKEEVGRRLSSWFQSKHDLDQHKDRELIQTLVNVLAKTTKWAHSAGRERFMWTEEEAERAMSDEVAALALAGEQGYKPTEK